MSAHDTAWDSLWAEARAVDILDVAQRLGVKLKRNGADWTGHCPGGCTSHGDGFVVTPSKHLFLCRPSGATGDAVEMVVHAQAFTKAEALEFVTQRELPGKQEPTPAEKEARQAELAKRQADIRARAERDAKEAEARRQRDEEAFLAVLKRAVPIEGTHAAAYLAARGLSPPKGLTRDLRFVRDLDYFGHPAGEDRAIHLATLPAMVAVIRDVNGAIIGISQTYLDQNEPKKWVFGPEKGIAPKKRKNPPVKVRGEVKGGMVRLGMVGEHLAIAEGVITALSWHQLGFGPEDVTIAAAVSLGNMAGAWTGTQNHPTRTTVDGKATKVPNGIPDMARPGVILPAGVREVILIGEFRLGKSCNETGGPDWRKEVCLARAHRIRALCPRWPGLQRYVDSRSLGEGGCMIRALDLFCGAGGVTRGLQRAGFEVTGVDLVASKRYCGDEFIQADVTTLWLENLIEIAGIDFVWASPPCQGYTSMRFAPGAKGAPKLIESVRKMLIASGKPYCIENVEGARAAMCNPIMLCGCMFGLGAQGCRLERRRLFECSFPVTQPKCRCKEDSRPVIGVYGGHARKRAASAGGRGTKDTWVGGHRAAASEAMGIDWMTLTEMSEAIPPAYAEYIALAARQYVMTQRRAA